MRYKYPGPAGQKLTHGQFVTAFVGKEKLREPAKLPSLPCKSRQGFKRKPYKREEDVFRKQLISYLRKRGCQVWRLEPSFRGEWDLADLLVWSPTTLWLGVIEVKSLSGRLTNGQKGVKAIFEYKLFPYIVAKKIDDCAEIFE